MTATSAVHSDISKRCICIRFFLPLNGDGNWGFDHAMPGDKGRAHLARLDISQGWYFLIIILSFHTWPSWRLLPSPSGLGLVEANRPCETAAVWNRHHTHTTVRAKYSIVGDV